MVRIVDTTLRDGEQTPGVSFTINEKVTIAKMLDAAGVHFIEAGTPAMGHEEKKAVKEIIDLDMKSEIITWNRAVKSDVDHSLEIGAKNIHLSLPVSDLMIERKLGRSRSWVIATLREITGYTKGECINISVGAEDASRASEEFLLEYAMAAQECGALRFRFCDTVGIMDPFTLNKKLEPIVKGLNIDVEVHTHNDFGMATANALAGIKAGAQLVDTTITGLGERAGNAPLEEVVMGLKVIADIDTGVETRMLKPLADYVSVAAQRPVPDSKSIVGAKVFTHESGIHVDGIMKDPNIYEPFDPALVGVSRSIAIGKHSSKKAVINRLRELGFNVNHETSNDLMDRFRKIVCALKGGLSDEELLDAGSRFLH